VYDELQPLHISAASNLMNHFTSKERDAETGLDYFGARYYSGAQGRFTSVDPGLFTIADPQSWNRYSYVQNNPPKNGIAIRGWITLRQDTREGALDDSCHPISHLQISIQAIRKCISQYRKMPLLAKTSS
jgi:RHS repeat-associated protein